METWGNFNFVHFDMTTLAQWNGFLNWDFGTFNFKPGKNLQFIQGSKYLGKMHRNILP
jgi:hypothetical protein